MRRSTLVLLTSLLAVAGLAACGDDYGNDDAEEARSTEETEAIAAELVLTSEAFADGEAIPVEFTCEGAGTSPPLAWSSVPDGTDSLLLVVDDPDAPGGSFIHWVVEGVDPSSGAIPAGDPPDGVIEGTNGAGATGWAPPCPPPGDGPHRYVFQLLALSAPLDAPDGADAETALAAAEETTLATTTLTGTYAR